MNPTIILVHGAFAESSSWDAVIDPLVDAGHPVIAAANPLRSLASDAAAVADVVRTVEGPVEGDHIIRAALQHYMAERAGARRTLEIPGASHAITVSHPEAVAHQILEAAAVSAAA